MVDRRNVLTLLAGITSATALQAQEHDQATYVTWVANVLKRMETVKSGMTRETLLTFFATEGGLSTGLQRTYVSQECPYFKVDIEFDAVGGPSRDSDGRVTLIEDPRDIILKMSRPYLQFSVMD